MSKKRATGRFEQALTESRRRTTIADVAAAAGVSPSLVSLILNGRSVRVADTTRERVLRTVNRLHYVPNAGARAIGGRCFYCVGLIISAGQASSHFLPSDFVHGLAEALNAQGYRLTIMHLAGASLTDPSSIPALHREWQVDGLLTFLPTQRLSRGATDLLQHHGVPAVFVNAKGFDHVVRPDDYASGREAVNYLVQHGHRRIVHVTSERTDHYSRQDRYQGWADACHAAELPIPSAWYKLARELGPQEWAVRLADMPEAERPTAATVFALGTAQRLIHALRERGLTVPRDLSVFSQMTGDTRIDAEHADITGVAFDWSSIGRHAAELILHLIKSASGDTRTSEPPEEILEPPRLFEGHTVRSINASMPAQPAVPEVPAGAAHA